MTVDFAALVDVIDAVGGVEIDVTEEEIPYLITMRWKLSEIPEWILHR